MYIPKKEQIIPLVIKLETDVKQAPPKWFIQDDRLPSLYLWAKHIEYISEIMALFQGKDGIKNLVKIYNELKIDDFVVEAKNKYNESKGIIEDHILECKRKLDIL